MGRDDILNYLKGCFEDERIHENHSALSDPLLLTGDVAVTNAFHTYS